MLAVERHYLKTYGGGFTENFYGLKRERVLRIKGGEAPRAQIAAPDLMRDTLRLQDRDVWNNLFIMVGLPYLKRKLDESYDIHAPQATLLGPSYNRDSLSHDATIKQRILYSYKWFLRKVYPSINAAYYLSLLAFNLAYLFDNTKYSSPFLWVIGTRIRRLDKADYRAIGLAMETSAASTPHSGARPGQGSSLLNPAILVSVVYPRLLSGLKVLLPTSIFALKFLEWWHASDFANQLSKKAAEGLNLPPPVISGLPSPNPRSILEQEQTATPNVATIATNTVSLSPPPPSSHNPIGEQRPVDDTPPVHPKPTPPKSAITRLPIHTVAAPQTSTSTLCPICLHPIQTPTSAQTGYVFCYTCIFKWVDGAHDRQRAFMEGKSSGNSTWDDDDGADKTRDDVDDQEEDDDGSRKGSSREGKWESGKGRCAVTGRRVLGGTDGLRRIMV